MKLNQKILKAINEGIRKSLLSFDDIEFNQSTDTNQKVTKSIEDWQFIHENFVDLGLPSGTLWCKYNLGATNGDTPESWYGNYYAWGEVKPKKSYTERTYKYKENPNTLPLDRDVAHLTSSFMRMPTKKQIEELVALPNKWVKNYNKIKGLNGRLFTGSNGNTLFIPAAGFHHGSGTYDQGSYCHLWTLCLNQNRHNDACNMYFNDDDIHIYYLPERYYGYSVRPVLYQ